MNADHAFAFTNTMTNCNGLIWAWNSPSVRPEFRIFELLKEDAMGKNLDASIDDKCCFFDFFEN